MNQVKLKRIKAAVVNFISLFDKTQAIYNTYKKIKSNKPVDKYDLYTADKVLINWPDGVSKPFVGLVQESNEETAYWPKYERFLRQNNIPYEFYNPHRSDFWVKSLDFDLIIWRTSSIPCELVEAKAKIELLVGFLGKEVLPKVDALWFYEEKIKQQWLLEIHKLPCPKTFITHSYQEAMDYINNIKYPIVSKESISSASQGVSLIKTKKQARKLVRNIFNSGRRTTLSYLKQKDYVIFQEFTPTDGFDLRVIIIGNCYFGYFRYAPTNDFRASGAGIVEKKEIPVEALLLAKKVKELFPDTDMLAVDMLQDKRDHLFKVIETSVFIRVDTCEQLKVEGVPGFYQYYDGKFHFKPGRYWIQEFVLKEAMEQWIRKNKTTG